MIKVLVVDDSALARKLLGQIFGTQPDFQVELARDGAEALALLPVFQPDVITLDIHMPRMDGLACLDQIMVERPTPVVMVSSLAEGDAEETLEALRLGAVDFMPKPRGAVSLHIHDVAPELIEKVRAAAGAKLRASLRLKDRVRRRVSGMPALAAAASPGDGQPVKPATGDGLVLVGCSTGGPPALEALLVPLPASFPWPIVVAQHMPASFTGALARRLDGLTAVRVEEVTAPTILEPGCVYIGRGDADVVITRRSGGLTANSVQGLPDYLWRPSTDRLVRTAMEHLPASQLIGVLMTGMGDDGAKAMTELHGLGGRTIAEAEETAVVWGMPGELVKAGGADFVAALPRIADRLRALAPPCR